MNDVSDDRIASFVRDKDELILQLGVNVSSVPPHQHGASRYQKVSDAYDQLDYASRHVAGIQWEKVKVQMNGRDGTCLMRELGKLKQALFQLEGPPSPEQAMLKAAGPKIP
jgi:hypothetical protein